MMSEPVCMSTDHCVLSLSFFSGIFDDFFEIPEAQLRIDLKYQYHFWNPGGWVIISPRTI